MPLERVYLGWDRPALAVAVEYLARRFAATGSLDFSGLVVAVPGARAGRRLLELLVERAETTGQTLTPPEILTVGRMPELLYTARRPFAGDLVQQLAWVEALKGMEPGRLAPLLPHPPEADDLPGWLALGEMLGRLHRELAADALDFQAVVDAGRRLAGFAEADRWAALLDVQRRYLETLDRLGLWDLQTARLFAIRQGECATERQIVLVGTVDLNRAQRMMLDQVEERATALVFAPAELAERFDGYGCLEPAAWQDVPIAIETDQIEVVDGPADQAAAVVRAMAALGGRYAADEITVGVPDARIVPYLQQRLRQCGVEARWGVGTAMARSTPCRLLAAAAEYVERRRFSAFAALVRQPAVQDWLEADGRLAGDWLSRLDEYYAKHLPLSVGRSWLGSPEASESLVRLYERMETLLGELTGPPRPLDQWGPPLFALLTSVFGRRPLESRHPSDRAVLAACEALSATLAGYEEIPDPLRPTLSAAAAIRLLLRAVGSETIAPLPDPRAVELLGWLELPWDDAPVLIVTSVNEGFVPASSNEDLFLPNQLRRELGVLDNDRRLARDVYAMSLLAASRRRLHLVAGRRSSEGDPLVPSRLLFATDPATAAGRTLRFFRTPPATAGTDHEGLGESLRPRRAKSVFAPPRPAPLAQPVRDMRVTEFRDYLACPYRYYLRHRLGLKGLKDEAEELDGGPFGSLAHDVLGEFGRSDVAGSTDPERIAGLLDAVLDDQVRRLFGRHPLPAILVQVEQIRARLRRFAHWQADRAAAGWRIERVESGPEPEQAVLLVDGQPMYLHGRIDRIDLNEGSGRRAILDYKTADAALTPDKAHRRGDEWIDLQLPLYRHLLAGMGIKGLVELGYLLLPKDTAKIGLQMAEWTDDELARADAAAENVVRRVRAGEFWPPTTPAPPFAEDFSAICHDGQFGALEAAGDADEEGDSP